MKIFLLLILFGCASVEETCQNFKPEFESYEECIKIETLRREWASRPMVEHR